MSAWLQRAIPEAVRRDPLLAAEDAIMLADIFTAFARGSLAVEAVLATPLTGDWLRQAVVDNLGRPFAAVIRDSILLRDLLVANLAHEYRGGRLSGPDVDARIAIIVSMVNGVVDNATFECLQDAGSYVQAMVGAEDGGASMLRDCAELERERGHEEMAEIIEQLSDMTEDELRGQLSFISKRLLAIKKTSQ